MADISHLTFRG